MDAIIYIAHGSRSEHANQQFVTFIKKVMDQIEVPIQEYGFLEKAEPSILEAVERCAVRGAIEVAVIPVLLMPGIHANIDIPYELELAKNKYPNMKFRYGKTFGADEIMADLTVERLRDLGFTGGEDESVLLVGHGSRDTAATLEFSKLSHLLSVDVHIGFLTQEPFFQEQVTNCKRKVYVLPYLLFSGPFMRKIKDGLQPFEEGYDIVVGEPIGFDPKLEALVVKRVLEMR